ncbi:LuxR C-terminal-related transcriptional regulator [Curtobacterium sp. Leaf261]|uniref:LuxR C-terminal-related transcriptional regulator n=1 Tax=Curtobacterium sp. Leaf261 TaxID=1736311 RepID=UPI000700B716|nr:LuxR C-terminal-related transcriptional regulator [Curtobacterium sp. Leaf261]
MVEPMRDAGRATRLPSRSAAVASLAPVAPIASVEHDPLPARLSWPVLERREENRAVAVVGDHRWSVAIVGSAGLGKSVVAAAVVDRVARADRTGLVTVLPITASPNEAAKPFAAAIAHFGDLPEAVLADESGAERRLRESADLVGRDVLLRVDDADQLDPMSARYVAWLVRHADARLVLTCRDFTALAEPLRQLWQDDMLERIDLAPLDLDETDRLMALALDGPLEAESLDRLHRATHGNPLHLREVVRAAHSSGALERTATGWWWPGRVSASKSLEDLYRTELAELSGDLRDVVDIVALADPIPLSRLLALVADADVDRVVALGFVTVDVETATDGTPVVRPSHPLVGDVVRSLVPVSRRTRLFARANAFRADPAEGAPPAARLRASLWALECGVVPPTDQLLDAARVAVRLQEYESATVLASAALAGSDTSVAASVSALCTRATARTYSTGRESARHDAERAWDLASTAKSVGRSAAQQSGPGPRRIDDALVVEAAEGLANLAQFHDDDVDRALEIVDVAAAMVADPARERLRMLRLTHLGWAGRFHEVLTEVDRSGVLDTDAVPLDFLTLAPCGVIALAVVGRVPEAYALAAASITTASAHVEDAPWSLGELASVLHQVQMWCGDLAGLTLQVGRRPSPFFKYDYTLELLGTGNLAIAERRWADAATAFRAACERFEVADHGGFAAYPWARLALALVMLGRTVESAAALDRARSIPARGMRITAEELPSTMAVTEFMLGRPTAVTHASEIVERSERSGAWLPALFGLMMLHEAESALGMDPTTTLTRIRTAAARVQTPVARAYLGYREAVERGDAAGSRAARTELADHGFPLSIAQLGRSPLTPREYEVAELAAQGLSNRQVAEHLGRSVRTVDAHMSRIFAKWGLHSRGELVDLV